MPLEDTIISKEPDGTFNEDYCKWCYADGQFVYHNMDDLLDYLEQHMSNEQWSAQEVRAYFKEQLAKLDYWSDKQP